MTRKLVEIRNLHKAYRTPAGMLPVLKGIDLDIYEGDFVAIVGASGVGKTTLLNMITGIDKPTQGEVIVDGKSITNRQERQLTKWRARNIGIVFQFFQLLPTLTCLENIMFPMDYANVHEPHERQDLAITLLAWLGIEDQAQKTPDMLSGGQQQRVAVARALANDPPLVVGDEPTANLDRMSSANVFNIFQKLADKGSTVIVVSYDYDIVQMIPRVFELSDGKLYALSGELS
jgi:putative ABC transport system ATP-binding protein